MKPLCRPKIRASLLFAAAALAILRGGVSRAQAPVCTDCLTARDWRIDPDDWKSTSGKASFLEDDIDIVKDRPSVGVAFSGGGTRSATATLGALRGMKRNGWLGQVRYVSAVSGGAWTAIPFTYSMLPLDELLGTVEDFQARTFSAEAFLEKPNGQMAKAIAESSLTAPRALEVGGIAAQAQSDKGGLLLSAFLQLTRQLRVEPDRIDKTYTRLIGKTFIDKLVAPGRPSSGQFFTWDARSLKAMPRLPSCGWATS